MLHFTYHSSICDLTRVSLPGFDFPIAALFGNAPPAFRRQCQEKCRYHADEISRLVELGFVVGGRSLDDPFCIGSAFEASKIQVVHTTTSTDNGIAEHRRTRAQLAINLRVINRTQPFKNQRATNYVSRIAMTHGLAYIIFFR